MLAPVRHILPLTVIERERTLPVAGNVMARLDQKVSPTDVIAEANWAKEHILIDVTRTFGIPVKEADTLIQVKVGERVSEQTKIAVGGGMFPRTLRAGKPGRVVAAGGGQVLIETGETTLELKAGLPGTVAEIIPDYGAIIRTYGALIQGVWGNGRIDTGLMLSLAEGPDEVLIPSRLDVSLRGSIILAGIVRDAETLLAAAELPARGLILSSISPAIMPVARKMRLPIVVIEGFGQIPMNPVAYKLLSTNEKREVTLNAEAYNRYTGARPEVIIPLPVSQEPAPPLDVMELEVGQTVRIGRQPNLGETGTLSKIRPGLTTLPSGLRAQVAEIKLENGDEVLIPIANLEIVG